MPSRLARSRVAPESGRAKAADPTDRRGTKAPVRASETEWTLITVDTNNPYVDGRPPLVPNTPELRQYRARYRDNDLPVGDWSDTVSATAQA
ncbi:MAG: hypothetical protein WD716_01860 [Fimbriimonadaceae bacterium]